MKTSLGKQKGRRKNSDDELRAVLALKCDGANSLTQFPQAAVEHETSPNAKRRHSVPMSNDGDGNNDDDFNINTERIGSQFFVIPQGTIIPGLKDCGYQDIVSNYDEEYANKRSRSSYNVTQQQQQQNKHDDVDVDDDADIDGALDNSLDIEQEQEQEQGNSSHTNLITSSCSNSVGLSLDTGINSSVSLGLGLGLDMRTSTSTSASAITEAETELRLPPQLQGPPSENQIHYLISTNQNNYDKLCILEKELNTQKYLNSQLLKLNSKKDCDISVLRKGILAGTDIDIWICGCLCLVGLGLNISQLTPNSFLLYTKLLLNYYFYTHKHKHPHLHLHLHLLKRITN
jgi:hypothetical protein